jgi:hypothetical protein
MPCVPSCGAMRRTSTVSHAGEQGQRAESHLCLSRQSGEITCRAGDRPRTAFTCHSSHTAAHNVPKIIDVESWSLAANDWETDISVE